MKKLAIGEDDLKKLREHNACFVDKSLFIEEVIEEVHHIFLLDTLITLKDSYHIESERESGYGRVDILMTPNDKNRPGIIIEMKKIRPCETTKTALEAALQQIEDRQYEAALHQQGCTNIMKVAVTFDRKRVWAKTANTCIQKTEKNDRPTK